MERLTIGEYFDRIALGAGEREALVFPDQRVRWGYRDTHARTTQLAKGLMGIGVDTGDHVAIVAANRAEWVLAQLAVAKVGAVLVPIDPECDARTLVAVLAHADASTLLVSGAVEAALLAVVPELAGARPGHLAIRALPRLRRVALVDADADPSAAGVFTWSDVLRAGAGITDHLLRRRQETIEPTDLVYLQYAAAPDVLRGVELTHLNIVNNALAVGDNLHLSRRDRVCVPVTFARPFGSVLGTLMTLGRGATLVVPSERFDAGTTLAAVAAEHCTALHATPRMLGSLVRHPAVIQTDVSTLRTGLVMGAPVSAGVLKEGIDRLHLAAVTVGHGRDEATGVVTQTRTDDSPDLKATTVGRPILDVEVKIVHPKTGDELPRGAEGELCCRGYLVMRGYHKMPDLTATTIGKNGWLRTRDLAVMDQYGYCAITRSVDAPSQTIRDPESPGPSKSPVI